VTVEQHEHLPRIDHLQLFPGGTPRFQTPRRVMTFTSRLIDAA
jgi:hypothetical protein